MQISAEELAGNVTRVKLSGRLDIAGTGAIETRLAGHLAASRKGFILDFAEVTFLASIGIRALLVNAKAVQARGGKLAILDPLPQVAEVLALTGIDKLIPICSGLDAARDAVESP